MSAPTLVLHSRHDNAVPFEEGRRLAAAIPNARFVALESENHVPLPDEPAWPQFIGEIEAFLREDRRHADDRRAGPRLRAQPPGPALGRRCCTARPEVTGDQMVAAMDAVGVDGAMLVSPFSMYRYDASYALEVHARHPGRFGLVKPVDPADPAVAETIAEWAATPGTVGIRIMLNRDVSDRPRRSRASTASWPPGRATRCR